MSFKSWKVIKCRTCPDSDALATWTSSIDERCYASSMASIFFPQDQLNKSAITNSFITTICLPNQYIMNNEVKYANYCLDIALNRSDTACSVRTYNPDYCHCDYTASTKAIVATTILSALSLGILLFLTHFVALVNIDYVLRWLIPLCFGLMIFSIIFMIATLSIAGASLGEDLEELRYQWSLFKQAYPEKTLIDAWQQELNNLTRINYSVSIGWCFGMEIVSLYFALIALVVYALIFQAKKRPEPKNK
ncbi:unnamed protein product [Rotaria socialis]|uniref:Uncharacterized protein n=1 Tax=Rotaria socialis TaxID=392032 RepID=A0A818XXN2_9BILA|nr:unnamed protein product [Rotaria socialis]CAF3327091.1 unnamed protein product [Rotaria socialis]CAF3365353.1 unnamed protein product [Rotaria socialis]CAF3444831.1 unnamed protein product [Rotaria socialis]CAF3746684.1 unnamed protein product [Rotaria socialis]